MTRIREHMTLAPITIDHTSSLAEALELMAAHAIHHLLVLDDGKLIGVLSERDLYRLESHKRVDPEVMSVAQAMTPEPYTTAATTPLPEVLRTMAEQHHESAVVLEGDRPIGVFTATDALRLLASMLSGDQAMASRSLHPDLA